VPGRQGSQHERYDAVDHLMTYLFSDVAGLAKFGELSTGLARKPGVCRTCFRRSSAPSIV
jgi:hypothetical protein